MYSPDNYPSGFDTVTFQEGKSNTDVTVATGLVLRPPRPPIGAKPKKFKTTEEKQDQTPAGRRASMTWAQRLKRVDDTGRDFSATMRSFADQIASRFYRRT
jgi:hypothetical protein